MRAAIYCRLSREDAAAAGRGQESESIKNQRSMLLEYARQQGYEVCGIYCDEDYSGADRRRPAFNRMLEAASRREFDLILAKTQSRFTRDMELVESYLHGKFAEWGVRFIAVLDHADTADPAGKKSRQINGLVNEWYLEDLSNNVRSVLTHKRREGRYIASFALYGYQKDPLDPGRLVIDPEAAAVVRRIFALYLAGSGITRIAQLLNGQGIPSPARYKQLRGIPCQGGAGLWGRATVHQMLRNRTYMGDLVQGRHKKVSYKSSKTVWLPKEQWIVVPGTHEPIIDPETFARVQQLMAVRARGGGSGHLHPLAGRVVCGVCGGVMEQTGAGGSAGGGLPRRYFRCRMPLRAPGVCAGQPYLPAGALEGLVLDSIRAHAAGRLDPAAFSQSAARLWAERQGKARQAELARLRAEAAKRGRALRQLYLDKCEGLVGPEQFARLNAAFLAEQAQLERQCARLAEALGSGQLPDGNAAARELQARLQRAAALDTLDRTLVSLLLQRVVVYPPQEEGMAASEDSGAAPESPGAAPESPGAAPESPGAAPVCPAAAPENPAAAPENPAAAPENPAAAPENPAAAPLGQHPVLPHAKPGRQGPVRRIELIWNF